ncbi:MAG TPA: HEAT repeat domain-containing protein, partial [Candidatus Wallbacteria bacterium]|nr:HEAT repeat domain-containing protein [Candidatus Wallbacteria bacterium]
MAEKVFKDGKLVVIKTGRTIHDLKRGQMNDPLSHKDEKPQEESVPVKHSYISTGRNNEPLTDELKAKIEKLGAEGTTEAMISLIQLFSHPKWAARKLASDIMVGFGEKTVPVISQTVFLSQNTLDEDSLYWSIRTLGTIGALATPALVTVLNSVVLPKSYKVFVVRAMESCKTKEGIAALINCFNDESWLIRREAGNILMKMGDLVVAHLKAAFTTGSEDVRYWSVKILGGILGKGAIEYFKKMLKSEKRDMRYFAAAALGEIGDEEALDSLAETFSDDSWLVRAQVAEILEKKGKAAVKVLKKVLEAGSSDAKFMAIKLMSKILGKDAVNYISKIVSTADTDLKFFGLSALAETMDE